MKLVIDKKKVEEDLISLLKDSIQDKIFRIVSNKTRRMSVGPYLHPNIAVEGINGKTIAFFEIEPFPQGWALRVKSMISLAGIHHLYRIKYYVITNGEEFWVCSNSDGDFIQLSFSKIVEGIKKGLPVLGPEPSQDDIVQKFKEATFGLELKQTKKIIHYLGKERKKPLFRAEADTGRIMFSTMASEDAFFSLILNEKVPYRLCRFTTRQNLFLLLKDKKQNMCSIVCMNDRSEDNYADNKVRSRSSRESRLRDSNNCFILSLLPEEKTDDLIMWRLYGDDAKGVCLNYELVKNRGKRLNKGFYISSINYGLDEDNHPELEYLKRLIGLKIENWHFQFNRWYIWKHFFKSFRFKDEKEVRLLYLSEGKEKDKVWIENANTGIVSKMLFFPINSENEFPLMLCNAIIGPKAPEPDIIAEQFTYLVAQEWGDSSSIVISESAINEYR